MQVFAIGESWEDILLELVLDKQAAVGDGGTTAVMTGPCCYGSLRPGARRY